MPNLRRDKNKKAARQRFSFPLPFPELRWSLFKFNHRKNCQNLTNWTRWNKRDQVWSSATLPQFKWRFCSRRRSCCFKSSVLGTLRSDDGDGNGNATKTIGLITKKQQFCACITLFCTFLCPHCTTTKWKCLISHCTEKVHKRRRDFLSLSALGYGTYEFNFRMVRLHWKMKKMWLGVLVTWSNRDEDWKNTNSLFQRRFLCRRRERPRI